MRLRPTLPCEPVTSTAGPKRPSRPGTARRRGLPVLVLGGALALAAACVEQTNDTPSEDDVKAARQHVLSAAPTPQFVVNATLKNPSGAGKIVYLGMDAEVTKVSAGQPFTLTHYYKVEEPFPDGWRMFVHLGGAPGERRQHLNADHVPVGGKYPLHLWKKGEIIRDIHKVSIPASWPLERVHFYVGFWKGSARAKIESGPADNENRVHAASLTVSGGSPPPPPVQRRLLARRLPAGTAPTIDGKLDEAVWQSAASTGPFVNTMSGAAAEQVSEAKVLWDDNNLYVAFDFKDTDIWGALLKHDDKLWTQEAAELFIDADGDQQTYVELQVSPRNTTFDSWLPAYRKNDNAWDAPIKTAVNVRGTLDKRDDKDEGWTVEMMIPLETVKGRMAEMRNVPPKVGTEWRVNFFRMDMPSGKTQNACAWSPPLVGDFHALDKFGVLVFTDESGKLAAAPPAPADKAQNGPAGPNGLTARPLTPEGTAGVEAAAKAPVAAGAAPPAGEGKPAKPKKGKKPAEKTP